MLGDNAEKSKNPLKKAMRRRNTKTVTFTAPTYVDPVDYGDFSDEEEIGEGEMLMNGTMSNGDGQETTDSANDGETEKDETAVVEPLKVNGTNKSSVSENTDRAVSGDNTTVEPKNDNDVQPRSSDEIMTPPGKSNVFEMFVSRIDIAHPDGSRGKSRNGTVRNTDSFFKDDSVETRKITLTPNLLRDDSSSTLRSIDAKESNIGDKLEKSIPPSERPKDDKKRKEKKPGMLSGFFKSKKKDKKGKVVDEDDEKDMESSRMSSPTSQETFVSDKTSSAGQQTPSRQLSKGKLQKSPPTSSSPSSKVKSPIEEAQSSLGPSNLDDKRSSPPSTMRLVQSEPDQVQRDDLVANPQLSEESQNNDQHLDAAPSKERGGKLSPITNLIRPSEPRPEKVKKAKQRVELDDFDSSPDEAVTANPFDDSNESSAERTSSENSESLNESERSAEASKEMSPIDSIDPRRPPPLVTEIPSEEDQSQASPAATRLNEEQSQPISTSSSTPTITSPVPGPRPSAPSDQEATSRRSPHQYPSSNAAARSSPSSRNTDTPPTPSSQHTSPGASNGPVWSDSALYAYMNGENDIRDMLLLVRDKTNVVPVSTDHPLMKDLFVDERKSLKDMDRQLDGLLGQWMERKGMAGPSVYGTNARRRINGATAMKI